MYKCKGERDGAALVLEKTLWIGPHEQNSQALTPVWG